ncbi:hypothetical protein OG21DRAFT_640536 [Imleria badia]|nr:hypothetical protein OG21DRAFT_640536 [Imleria badia]
MQGISSNWVMGTCSRRCKPGDCARSVVAALHKAGDCYNAVDVLEMMLSKSPLIRTFNNTVTCTPTHQAHERRYVQWTLRHLQRVLINTTTGRLHNYS